MDGRIVLGGDGSAQVRGYYITVTDATSHSDPTSLWLRHASQYDRAMQRQAISIAQRIAAAQQRVTEARLALAEAAKQRKVMEKLREKHHERWRADQAAKEFRELDEIGVQLAVNALADSGDDA